LGYSPPEVPFASVANSVVSPRNHRGIPKGVEANLVESKREDTVVQPSFDLAASQEQSSASGSTGVVGVHNRDLRETELVQCTLSLSGSSEAVSDGGEFDLVVGHSGVDQGFGRGLWVRLVSEDLKTRISAHWILTSSAKS
jgi:hypothetical protein